jgi:hypothetical protein
MHKYFHKVDQPTKKYMLYRRKGGGLIAVAIGIVWAIEMAGYFNMIPYHEYFLPAVLVVGGLFEIFRAFQLQGQEFK